MVLGRITFPRLRKNTPGILLFMPGNLVYKTASMKKSRLQPFLQSLAVLTQFPPFTWLYRQIYALAVRLCVRRLQRIRGSAPSTSAGGWPQAGRFMA
jgi:hypothetical protein